MSLAAAALAAPGKAEGTTPIALLERARQTAMGLQKEEIENLRLNAGTPKLEAGAFKFELSDRIQAAIEILENSFPGAEPGNLYLGQKTGKLYFPTPKNIKSLIKHAVTERGAIPIFKAFKQEKSSSIIGYSEFNV